MQLFDFDSAPVQCCFDRGGIKVDPVPRCARPAPPTTPANPAPRRPHQPPTRIQEVAPAASRRRQRVGPIAGRSADQRRSAPRTRGKYAPLRFTPPQFSAVSIGVVSKSTRYLAALARRRRPHQRIRRRGGRTSPQPEFKKWRRRPAGGASGSVRLRVGLLTNVARLRARAGNTRH